MCDPEILELRDWVKIKLSDGLWHKRFAVLNEHQLAFYKDEITTNPELTLLLTTSSVVEHVDDALTPRFSVHDGDGPVYLISCDRKEVVTKWMTAIQNSLEKSPILSMACFKIISVIGRGFFGKVMLVQHITNGEFYAIKSIQKKRLMETKKFHTVIAERNILMKAKHPFIVRLCFAFQTPSKFYLGLEYAAGGELFYIMDTHGVLPLEQVRLYMAEIALALNYLHSIGIVYRDMKPENVLLDSEGHIKLTDFGLSKELLNQTSTTTICGTTEYLAPEMVLKKPYGYGVDWWALGILCYEMLTETTPFQSNNRAKMLIDIVQHEPEYPDTIPEDVAYFIRRLLTKDPANRPDFDEISKFDMFKCYDWDKVYKREYQPVYVPKKGTNFDPEFTREVPVDSPVQTTSSDFPDFSFTGSGIPSPSERLLVQNPSPLAS